MLEHITQSYRGKSLGPFTAAVWREGALEILPGTGGDPTALFPFGCLQDAMIGALVCGMADEGKLSLADPLAHYLPAFANRDGPPILLAHLLSHSTGLWLEGPDPGQSEPGTAQAFVELLAGAQSLFEPGRLSVHSLLDRIVLLQVAQGVLGHSPYEEILRRFGAKTSTLSIQSAQGPLAACYRELHGALPDLATFLDRARGTSWLARAASGTIMRPITQSPLAGSVVPVADGLGLFCQANGLLGQDGDHPRLGFCGMRLSEDGSVAALGHFRSAPERDHILTSLICDLASAPLPPRSAPLGHLNGFDPAQLTGRYRGIWGMGIFGEHAEGQLRIARSLDLGAVPADIQPDGRLTGRWAAPNLWIEPQELGHESLIGLRFSKHLYVKDRHDRRLHDQ